MKARANAMELIGAAMVASLILVALLAPLLAPHDPTRAVASSFGDPWSPSWKFPLGTDALGRDVLSRIIYGAQVSLEVGITAMILTMTIGVAIGLSAGFFGGKVDFILMRFTDVMLTLPALLLAMALVSVLGPSIRSILIVIGIVSWTSIARVVRAEALSMSQRDFVMAALGTSGTLLLDAALSFLGLGVPPPTPSWGRMIEEATIYFRVAPWLATFPGLAIFYAVLGFNLLGYGVLRRRAR